MNKKSYGLRTVFAAVILASATVNAEISEDTHINRDDHVRLDIDRTTFDEFTRLYRGGYPPASVMLHGVELGMSIEDLVYLAVKSDPGRAQEFYDTAVNMAPSLPGWVCRSGSVNDRYANYISRDQLGANASIAMVASEWFNNNRMLAPFPRWQSGAVHLDASVSELAGLVDAQKFWYQPGEDDRSPLFVSLYRDKQEIVIDGDLSVINRAQQMGKSTLPVVVVYNQDHQRPLSRYGANATLSQVANDFFENRLEVTPVPEWKVGDFHKMASLDEIRALVNFPKKSDIPDNEWAEIESDIVTDGGMVKAPLLLTLLRSGTGRTWVNSPATLAVAESQGVTEVPVVLFFQDIDRQPCGQPSGCGERICDAAVAGGANKQVCDSKNMSALPVLEGVGGGELAAVITE